MQPHAAMRGGAPEISRLVGPVDRIAPVEEDRMRHWRAAIDGGAVPYRERLRPESADRRVIAAPGGRDRPGITRVAVHEHVHALTGKADSGDDSGLCRRRKTERKRED